MTDLSIEANASNDFGPCECCGANSRTVSGFIHLGEVPVAAYFVQWTLGQVERHGANFDLIVGPWGEAAGPTDRHAVSMALEITDDGPSFTFIDSVGRPTSNTDLVGRLLSADEVVGPLVEQAAEFVDAIWLQDERIAEIVAADNPTG